MAARKQKPRPRGASRTSPAAEKRRLPGWAWLGIGLVAGGFIAFLAQLEPGRDEVKRAAPASATRPATPPPPPEPARPKYEFYDLLQESPGSVAQPTPEQIKAVDAARAQALLEGRTPPPPLTAAAPPQAAPQAAAQPRPLAAPAPAAISTPAATPSAPAPAPAPAPTPAPATTAPARPASPPPAAPSQPASTRFVVQAGSFGSREQAESARARLILLGQDARIESGEVGGRTWHRVVVGPFGSRQQADSAQKQLAAGGINGVVQQRR